MSSSTTGNGGREECREECRGGCRDECREECRDEWTVKKRKGGGEGVSGEWLDLTTELTTFDPSV